MKNFIFFLFFIWSLGYSIDCESQAIENNRLTLQIKKQNISLSSKNMPDLKIQNMFLPGQIIATSKKETSDSLWGKGEALQVICNDGRKVTFTLYDHNPFLYIHTVMMNQSRQDIRVNRLEIASIDMSIGNMNKPLNTLGTGGFAPARQAQGSYTYTLLTEPDSRHSILTAWLTQKQGIGLMIPQPAKSTKAYKVKTELEFGNYLVKSGKERDTDILLIGFFEDGREGLELYGDYLAKAYQIHLPAKPEVYCTWYHRNLSGSGASTEKLLAENADFARKELAAFGLNTFQIDDHWQSSMGMPKNQSGAGPLKTFVENNKNFPSGMQHTAGYLEKKGFTPGLWFMPFSGDVRNPHFPKEIFAQHRWTGATYEVKRWSGTCIDATNPAGESFLRKRFKRIYNWGYRYYKIDGLHTGAPSENIYVNRSYDGMPVYGDARLYNDEYTFTQCFRKGLSILKEESPGVFLLGCAATQNMSSLGAAFGMVNAMRVGPDNDGAIRGVWKSTTAGADYAGNLYFLHNKVWYNDPDPYFVRSSNPLNKARWMVSWQAVSGVMSTTSMQYAELAPDRLDMIKRALPTHSLNARPVDILESDKPNIWMVKNDRITILGLFNWEELKNTQIDYSLERMGLNGSENYELFDFWDNKYLGNINGKLSQTLEPASCKVLAVRPSKSHPQVISTSRHITQGLMDIKKESWNPARQTLSGTSEVVKGDRYELRIIVPEGFDIRKAKSNAGKMLIQKEGKLMRVSFMPQKSGMVIWNIEFKQTH